MEIVNYDLIELVTVKKNSMHWNFFPKMFVAFENVRDQLCGRVRSFVKSSLPNSQIDDISDYFSSKKGFILDGWKSQQFNFFKLLKLFHLDNAFF